MALKTLRPRVGINKDLVKVPDREPVGFYSTPEWRALMERLFGERGRRCQKCGRTGCRLFGDHIQELKDGGAPLDPANIQILCGSCHTTKTLKARGERALK